MYSRHAYSGGILVYIIIQKHVYLYIGIQIRYVSRKHDSKSCQIAMEREIAGIII